jgi:hypothetical protein
VREAVEFGEIAMCGFPRVFSTVGLVAATRASWLGKPLLSHGRLAGFRDDGSGQGSHAGRSQPAVFLALSWSSVFVADA